MCPKLVFRARQAWYVCIQFNLTYSDCMYVDLLCFILEYFSYSFDINFPLVKWKLFYVNILKKRVRLFKMKLIKKSTSLLPIIL